MMLRRFVVGLWCLAAGLAALAGVAELGLVGAPDPGPWVAAAADAGPHRIGGEFELVDQDGRSRTWAGFRGKPVAVSFGFTNCPNVCPTTLGDLTAILGSLGRRGDDLGVVLVSADPARDTPAVLKDYLRAFDPRIVGLTGSEAGVAGAFAAFRAFRSVEPSADGGYAVNHSATVLLFDAAGGFAGTLDPDEPAGVREGKVRRLLGDAAPGAKR